MMTDRELLELAAKAAGVAGEYVADYSGDYYYKGNTEGILCQHVTGGWFVWNPLTDDGDALRLAIKLDLLSRHNNDKLNTLIVEEQKRNLRDAATRRAIVRAAAEIGRAMK